MYIRKDGKILYFENMKAQKNFFKRGRKPRETRWTEEYKIEKKSRMAAQAHAEAHKDDVDASPVSKTAARKAARADGTNKPAVKKAPAKKSAKKEE